MNHQNNLIVFEEEEIQSFAEANFGRELTEIELNRIKQAWWEDDNANWAKYGLMYHAIKSALDTKKNDWRTTDDYFKKSVEAQ